MKATFTTVSNSAFYDVLREDAEQGITNWTVSGRVHPGNRILLYICAPVSAIVATAIVSTTPQIEDDPSSPWFGSYMVDMYDLRMLEKPIKRETLMAQFPTWGYWKQPRNSVRVPDQYLDMLNVLLN